MSIAIWILLSLTTVFVALYIVGLVKKFTILKNISASLLLPLIGSVNILILKDLLPDSFHTIVITSVALILIVASQISFIFEIKKIFNIGSKILFNASLLCWAHLYMSSFYIYRVSGIIEIIFLILFIAISGVTCVLCGKQKIQTYISIVSGVFFSTFLSLFGFVFLIYGRTLHSILLYAGTITAIGLVIIYSLDSYRKKIKLGKTICLILLIVSQALIAYSNILMLY